MIGGGRAVTVRAGGLCINLGVKLRRHTLGPGALGAS